MSAKAFKVSFSCKITYEQEKNIIMEFMAHNISAKNEDCNQT